MNNPMKRFGQTVVCCLPDLEGKPWNKITQAFLRALRPSTVRVLRDGEGEKTDAVPWRVTVRVNEGRIKQIEQEVEVDLPDGVKHGYDLQCKLGTL